VAWKEVKKRDGGRGSKETQNITVVPKVALRKVVFRECELFFMYLHAKNQVLVNTVY
jgi:hypothetical protein